MKVRELIAILNGRDQEAEVVRMCAIDGYDYVNSVEFLEVIPRRPRGRYRKGFGNLVNVTTKSRSRAKRDPAIVIY